MTVVGDVRRVLVYVAMATAAGMVSCESGTECADLDLDAICDLEDPCVATDGNCGDDTDGSDSDSDDSCPDRDGDGVCNANDPCPDDRPPHDTDGDGVCNSDDECQGGNDHLNADGDAAPDECDNCPHEANNQADSDGDGFGDACDRPATAPDLVVFSVSGHDPWATGYNPEYLAETGSPLAIASIFETHGLSSEVWYYADEFFRIVPDVNNPPPATLPYGRHPENALALGFLPLYRDLEYVRDYWIADFENPTRIVVISHSHGVVWAHNAAFVVDVPIDFMVSLDGESSRWETPAAGAGDSWAAVIQSWNADQGVSWPIYIDNPADSWTILGVGSPQDTEDVVPENVLYNLEVQAGNFAFPYFFNDDESNHRVDGSTDGIFTSYYADYDHSEVTELTWLGGPPPGTPMESEPMAWVLGVIEDSYF